MRLLRTFALLAAASAILPFLSACGGSDDKTQPTVAAPSPSAAQVALKTQFCYELAGFKSAANQVNSLSATSTVDDTKKAYANFQSSWNSVKLAGAKVQVVKLNQLNDAVSSLDKQMTTLPPNATLGSAASQIAPQAQAVLQAETSIHTTTECPQN